MIIISSALFLYCLSSLFSRVVLFTQTERLLKLGVIRISGRSHIEEEESLGYPRARASTANLFDSCLLFITVDDDQSTFKKREIERETSLIVTHINIISNPPSKNNLISNNLKFQTL